MRQVSAPQGARGARNHGEADSPRGSEDGARDCDGARNGARADRSAGGPRPGVDLGDWAARAPGVRHAGAADRARAMSGLTPTQRAKVIADLYAWDDYRPGS